VIHRLIAQCSKKAPVVQLCRVFDVSRAGYYESLKRQSRETPTPVDAIAARAAFEASDKTYGSRRVSQALRVQGMNVGRHRARTLMRRHGLRPRWRRKFIHTTDSRHDLPVAGNVLARQFMPEAPNRAWVSDITYVRTGSGWLYLAVVIDLYSRKVVGWATSSSMPAKLVCAALRMAIASRCPPPGLIVHSDRGTQYASREHQDLLSQHDLVCSMSRKGNCWDNAVAERFFLSLKTERVWHRQYANHAEAQNDIADYIVGFYNPIRLHSTLGYRSPTDYELGRMAERAPLPI
jgi:transposase InsO family protein